MDDNVTTFRKKKTKIKKYIYKYSTNIYKTPHQPPGQNSPSYPVATQKPKDKRNKKALLAAKKKKRRKKKGGARVSREQ